MQKSTRKLIAVGDVHGQFEGFVKILRHAKLIDAQHHWCGGHNQLVQIGDILDRGPFSLKVDRLLDQLQVEAETAGGEVIRLIGNHELEIIMENYLISEFQREQAMEIREKLIGQVLAGDLKAAFAYKGFLFTHAGVTRKLFRIFNLQLEDPSAANLAMLINLIFKESIKHSFFKHPIFNIRSRNNSLLLKNMRTVLRCIVPWVIILTARINYLSPGKSSLIRRQRIS